MKSLFISILSIGVVVIFTSCASKNTTQAPPPRATEFSGEPAPQYGSQPLPEYGGQHPPTVGSGGEETMPGTIGEPISGAPEQKSDWPLSFSYEENSYSIYEPQCDSWNGHEFIGRSAVTVQAPGHSEPVYGAVGINAITLVDKNTRTVTLANVKIFNASFPSAPAQTQSYLAALRALPQQRVPRLSLDRVEGRLTLPSNASTPQLVNTPPRVFTATQPAVLVSIDGPPVLRPVSGTPLERVVNTRVLLLKDPSGHYYLHLFDGYLEADSLEGGHWTVASTIPDGTALAQEQALSAGDVDLMRGTPDIATQKEPSLSTSTVPDVFVATEPAELIAFNGEPEYVTIPGTDLLYADNTSGNVFKLSSDQDNYVLLAGRWYRAPSLNGPWEFVAGNDLPHDFAKIPDDSPKENVKASVPGTPQAQEALVANSIPQSAAVPRSSQIQKVQMDGPPQLAPIEGTPLSYVQNSATPIIQVGPQSWYACQDGVWYFSTSVNGPWSVATSVPSVVYTIPPSSPLYYLTYVQVYGSSPSDVYEGYTPGYMGTEVADDGTVVYGTGYNYAPWIGSVWYSPPVTWGFGFGPCWTPWWGWGFNVGFGWGFGYPGFGFGWWVAPPFPWWAGYRGFHGWGHQGWFHADREGWAHTGVNFYHRGDLAPGFRSQFAAGRFAYRGAGDFGRAYNSRNGQIAAGQWARAQNVHGSAWSRPYGGNYHYAPAPSFGGLRSGSWYHGGGGFQSGGGGGGHGR